MADYDINPQLLSPWMREKTDPGAMFLKGMAVTAEIGRKRQQLENQLAMYSLRQQQMEYNQEHQKDMYDLALKKLDNVNYMQGARLELQAEDNALDRKKFEFTTEKYRDVLEGRDAFIDAQAILAQQGLYPGMPGYTQEWDRIMGPSAQKVPTQLLSKWQQNIYNAHNTAYDKNLKNYLSKEKDFEREVSNTVWGTLDTDFAPILHPENYPKETKVEGATTIGGFFQVPYTGTTKETGRVLVTNPTGTVKDRPVSMADLTRLKGQWDTLQKEKESLGNPVNRPDLGVWAPNQPMTTKPIPISSIKDKADLRQNQPYESNKGIVRWTGEKFVPW